MEVSRSVVSKIDVSTVTSTSGPSDLATVEVVVFLDARRLSIEVVRGPVMHSSYHLSEQFAHGAP